MPLNRNELNLNFTLISSYSYHLNLGSPVLTYGPSPEYPQAKLDPEFWNLRINP
jgi:hypothetical protein